MEERVDERGEEAEASTEQPPVDYRFLLANERTYLAYLRTALSLQVAGLGVLQFLTGAQELLRYLLGLVLVVAGSVVGLSGHHRRRSNEDAIRSGRDLAPLRLATPVVLVVISVPLLAAVFVVLLDAN